MSGTAAFKVLRTVLYTVYLMVASTLAIACWTAHIHEVFRGKGDLRPLTVIGDVVDFVSGRTPTALTSLSDWLQAEAGTAGVIAIGAFVAGIGLFYWPTEDEKPAWFGVPTAYIALAAFWEIEPTVALWMGLGAFVIQGLIGGFQTAWDARTTTCAPEPSSGMGRLIFQWIFTTAGLVTAPINLVHELKELRATEARTVSA